jgi:hypothetical protein
MRVLIDECVDTRISLLLRDHKVATVHEQRWDTLEDGALLAIAQNDFDVVVTIDGSLEFQQTYPNLRSASSSFTSQKAHYRAIQKGLLAAIEKVRPREAIHVKTPPV